jgi:hypothetical protein
VEVILWLLLKKRVHLKNHLLQAIQFNLKPLLWEYVLEIVEVVLVHAIIAHAVLIADFFLVVQLLRLTKNEELSVS